MSKLFFTSDHHLYYASIFKSCDSTFSNVDQMNGKINTYDEYII